MENKEEKANDAMLENDGENDGAEEAKPRRKRRRRRPREYEFDDAENTILSRLAAKMTLVGLIGLAACVLAAGGLCVFFFRLPAGLPAMVNGVFFVALVWVGIGLLVSAWNLKAAHHFKIIVSTAGEDVPQLMSALGQLDRIYLVQCVFAVGGVVLFLLGLLTGDGVSAGPPTFAPPKVG